MFDAIKTALSGLLAAQNSLAAAATNVANSGDVSRLRPQAGDPPTFNPIDTVDITATGGGVTSTFTNVTPARVTVPDAQSPLADANGLVALPNVDLGTQLVNALTANVAFAANAKVIVAAKQMQDTLLKIDV